MKKILSILTLGLLLTSCGGSDSTSPDTPKQLNRRIGGNDRWEIFQANDSVIICIPSYNADKKLTPVVVNLKDVENMPAYLGNQSQTSSTKNTKVVIK